MESSVATQVINLCEKYVGDFEISNGEVVAKYCPFCHGGDHKDTKTFYIGLHNGAYKCHRGSCNESGSFRNLCEHFGVRAEGNIISFPTARNKKMYVRPQPDIMHPLTEEIIKYFGTRAISKETLEAFGVCSNAEGKILFPFYRNKELVYVKYREPKKFDKSKGKNKEWAMSNTEPILWNMDNVSYNKPLYITEGQCDAMALYEAGVSNVVSVPCGCNNFEWITNCWDWLEKFQQIVLFGDNDEPGIEMVSTLIKRLGEDRCMIAKDYPELIYKGIDTGRACKDANEILLCYGKDTLADIAKNSEPAPVKGIINLADVNFVDPTTVPRIMTRIPALDNCIGGLVQGGITVFSGKRGEGKSTLNGQLMLNAIQAGEKVCAYSGELSAQNFLNWIMLQATERKYLDVKPDSRSGKMYACVPYEIQQRIKKWIDGKFFLFDNNQVDSEDPQEAILKVFAICARRYGCKLFLVDNMMSVVSTAEEELKAQTRFSAALKNFAVKYNAHVLLVSHPRKSKAGELFTNDSVAGSANITNVADNVINVEKPNLRVTKNREFGTTEYIECKYDPANRRIFQANIGDRVVYGWDHSNLNVELNKVDQYPEFKVTEHKPETSGNPF